MPRGIKNRADSWEVRPIRKAPYVTAPRVAPPRYMLGLVFLPLLPRNDVGGISGKLPEQLGDKAIDRNAKHHAQNKRDKAAHYCHDELRSGN